MKKFEKPVKIFLYRVIICVSKLMKILTRTTNVKLASFLKEKQQQFHLDDFFYVFQTGSEKATNKLCFVSTNYFVHF